MSILLIALLIAFVAWFWLNFAPSSNGKKNVRIRFKAYESRAEAIEDEHDICGSGGFDQEVVGESSYQNEIGLIASKLPTGCKFVQATIELEDNNPHDGQAVAVKIGGLTVGHLPRDAARAYRKLAIKNNTPRQATCPAMIQGGGDMYYGIWLGIPEI